MLPASTRIFVCTEAVDLRKSFDGLAQCTREILECDPSSGALFLFAPFSPAQPASIHTASANV